MLKGWSTGSRFFVAAFVAFVGLSVDQVWGSAFFLGLAFLIVRDALAEKAARREGKVPLVRPRAVAVDGESGPPAYSRKCDARLRIKYRDAEGEVTERSVHATRYKGGDYALVYGRCSLRKEPRTFLVSRMLHCADEETGEVISDVPRWLRGKPPRGG